MRPAALREAPVTIPCLAAVALFAVWAQADAGLAITTWAPGAIALIGLLGVAAALLPGAWDEVPRRIQVATGLLAAFTAWSYLSILWARDPAAAWEGSNRTLLYLAVFALFALWPQRRETGTWVLAAWVAALELLAVVNLLRVPGAADALFQGTRMDEPAGYTNAAAATWLMAFWPAVLLAGSPTVAFWLRGLLAAGAVVLADLALLVQSRGSVFSVPIVALLGLALVPRRVRFAGALGIVLAGAAVGFPTLLDVGDAVDAGEADPAGGVLAVVAGGALLAGLAVAVWGWMESPSGLGDQAYATASRAFTVLAVIAGAAGAVGALAVAGNPAERLDSAWGSFKQGYAGNDASENRLVAGLGSNRYDFYRVGLDVFAERPLAGVGADGFFLEYLRDGRSTETPRYPHSIEIRTLSQLGIVGALLLTGFILAVFAAALPAMRSDGTASTAAVGAGGVLAFTYWLVHGSVDWFFEIAGLGAPAFALMGLAVSLTPRGRSTAPAWTLAPRAAAVGAGVLAALVIALPWLAERDVERAGESFASDPLAAYDRLDRAARLNPLAGRAPSVEGAIAVRYGDLRRAREAFRDALDRSPDDPAATLQLGAIESAVGNGPEALRLLRRGARLAPRDQLVAEALEIVADGGVIDPQNLARAILLRGRALTSD